MSKITYTVVSLVVIVLVIATAVLPVIEDAQSEQHTEYNNTSAKFKAVNPTDSVTIVLNEGYATVNDYRVDYSSATGSAILYRSDNVNVSLAGSQLIYLRDLAAAKLVSISTAGYTITIADGAWSYNTQSGTIAGVQYMIASNGDYGEYAPTSTNKLYVNKDTQLSLFITGTLSAPEQTSISYNAIATGTYDNLEIVSISSNVVLDPTATTIVLNPSNIIKEDALSYGITSMSVSITYTVEDVTYTATNSSTITFAPIKYIGISASDDAIISLLSVIPLMMFIIPIMICVGIFSGRRD